MIKSIGRKILIITLMIISVFIIISNNNVCQALSDVTDSSTWDVWEPTASGSQVLFSSRAGKVLGVIRTIGIIASVGSLLVIGIKFVLGSAEEKAQYKQTLIPWTIGAVMVFSITLVPSVIYNFATSTMGESGITHSGADTDAARLEGYDDGISFVEGLIQNPIYKYSYDSNGEYYEGYVVMDIRNQICNKRDEIELQYYYNNNVKKKSWTNQQYYYGYYLALNGCVPYIDNDTQGDLSKLIDHIEDNKK